MGLERRIGFASHIPIDAKTFLKGDPDDPKEQERANLEAFSKAIYIANDRFTRPGTGGFFLTTEGHKLRIVARMPIRRKRPSFFEIICIDDPKTTTPEERREVELKYKEILEDQKKIPS